MKSLLKHFLSALLVIAFMQSASAQVIDLAFTNRKVSPDGKSWTFDLEAKAGAGYISVPNAANDKTMGDWQGINLRMDLEIPAGTTIVSMDLANPQDPTRSNGTGNTDHANATVGVQISVPGSPAAGRTEVGFTLSRDAQADLTATFARLATFTLRFAGGTITQANNVFPRLLAIQAGSSWTNLAAPTRRLFNMPQEITLPVKLASFNAAKEGNTALLSWTTTEETNSKSFEVQRSTNGKKWETITNVLAKGESKVLVDYAAIDKEPLNGTNLYRLHMIDQDGKTAFSSIQSLNFDVKPNVSVYPNPVSDQLNILSSDWNKVVRVQILNASGLEVYKSSIEPVKTINVKHLAAGMYIVKVTEKNDVVNSYKIVLTK
jgi:hypothetical protein